MSVNDLAGGFTYAGITPEQLLAGDEPIKTAFAVASGHDARGDTGDRPPGIRQRRQGRRGEQQGK